MAKMDFLAKMFSKSSQFGDMIQMEVKSSLLPQCVSLRDS